MKLDHDYLRLLLEAFDSSEFADITLSAIRDKGFVVDENLIFHLRLLRDDGLIEPLDLRNRDLGYSKNLNGYVCLSPVPLRMTRLGYEFLRGLQQPVVLEKLKGLGDVSLGVATEVSKQFLIALALKSVGLS